MGKVTFRRVYQHGGDTFLPNTEYDAKDVPEILKGVAKPVEEKAIPKKKSQGAVTKPKQQ